MDISVVVEKVADNGYQATSFVPTHVVAEGRTREEALDRLCDQLSAHLSNAEVVTLAVPLLGDAHPWKAIVEFLARSSRSLSDRTKSPRLSPASGCRSEPAMSLYVLDTDHLSLYRYGHEEVTTRLEAIPAHQLAVTVITIEEQKRSWYTQVRRARDADSLARAYRGLFEVAETSKLIRVLPFITNSRGRFFSL